MADLVLFFVFGILLLIAVWLIMAFILKILMSTIFKRRVSVGMVLLAMVISTLFGMAAQWGLIWYSQGTLDPRLMKDIESSITPAGIAVLYLFFFMLQVLLFTCIVPDENLELIAGWKWAVVFVLQYVVFCLIIGAIALFLMGADIIPSFGSMGFGSKTSQILTRVV